jgi:ferredoxin, 2Fe-2S
MTAIQFIRKDGARRDVEAAVGTTVMVAAVTHAIGEIAAECGGNCMCATCHVYVEDQTGLPPLSDDEDALLDGVAAERRATSRLSCQLKLTDAITRLTVELPDRQT